MKNKLKCMLITVFDIKGKVYKEFALAGQTVNSAYCYILSRLCETFPPNFGNMDFIAKNITVTSHLVWTIATLLFPRLKTYLKGYHFDTSEVITAEAQAVMNSLREHLENWISSENSAYTLKGITFRGMVASKLKVCF
jgi:pantothenate kinase